MAITQPWLIGMVFVGIQILLLAQLVGGGRHLSMNLSRPRTHRDVHGQTLPRWAWIGKKAIRAPHLRIDIITAWLICVGIAVVAHRRGLDDPMAIAVIAAILAASVGASFRALAKSTRPFEIAGLKGSLAFTSSLYLTAIPLCFVAVSPLFWIAWPNAEILIQVLLGSMAGLFASTLTAPEPRDISGQFLATLLALSVLLLLPQVVTIPPLILTAALMAWGLHIEYKRNNYLWRKT